MTRKWRWATTPWPATSSDKDAEAGRITYYFKDGGRIDKDDFELGVIPAKDPGAFDQADIYKIEGSTHFCQAIQPSNQTEFGVFGHIGNNFGYKQGESFTPVANGSRARCLTMSGRTTAIKIAELLRKGFDYLHTRAGL